MKRTLRTYLSYIRHPWKIKSWFALRKLDKQKDVLPVKEYIEKKFKIDLGYPLNLEDPKTFNEKLQWLKLYNQQPVFTELVDKHTVKRIVSEQIGEEHVAKEYGCWKSFDEIDFDKLPDSFVLKNNHGVGPIVICRNKGSFNPEEYRDVFNNALKKNYFYNCFEWPYKNIKPRIICEELLSNTGYKCLPVFKFFCFDGEPVIAQIIINDKQKNETIDYIDMEYNFIKLNQGYPNNKPKDRMPKPANFEEMKEMAAKLSKGFPFLRCDFYSCDGKTYFSEFTFFSDAGFARFFPKKWDLILGEKIVLPTKKHVEEPKR